MSDRFNQEPWIRQILNDRRACSDLTYAEKRVLLSQLVDKLEKSQDYSAESLDVIFRNLRHVLVLAVDRLDYDTLHLVWLP